jgi:tetratricopeptide (TPR) repeat protein
MTPRKARLSLALIAKNEARCLDSIRAVADELVVVDTGSTDDTVRIARDFKAKVAGFAWTDDFSAARNFALAQTTGEWILVLDADEYASEALAVEIADFTRREPAIGRLKIVSDFRWNNQILRSQAFVSRLFPRGAHFEGRIHEQLVSPLPRLNLRAELFHDGYLEVQKSARNLKLLLKEVAQSPANAYYLYQLALEYSSSNQTVEAFGCLQRAYALLGGGEPFAPNVVVDYLYASTGMKQWQVGLELIEKTGRSLDDFPDFYLAAGLFYMNLVRSAPAKHLACLPKIEECFQRCLALGDTDKYRSVRGTGSFLASYNLGALYHAFGDAPRALQCFQKAASLGHEPALRMLNQLKPAATDPSH